MIRLCLISLHHLFYVMLIYWNPPEGQHETLNHLWMKSLFYFLFFHSFLWGKCDTCWVFDLPSCWSHSYLCLGLLQSAFQVQPASLARSWYVRAVIKTNSGTHSFASAQSYVLTQLWCRYGQNAQSSWHETIKNRNAEGLIRHKRSFCLNVYTSLFEQTLHFDFKSFKL